MTEETDLVVTDMTFEVTTTFTITSLVGAWSTDEIERMFRWHLRKLPVAPSSVETKLVASVDRVLKKETGEGV